MFSLHQLRAFVNVAENRSFTKAAKIMYMTQPAISAQIKALENRLEVRLLERNDKNIVLTEAGNIFYAEAQKILSLYDGFLGAINELKGVRRGSLLISASTIPGEYVLPRLIGGFKRVYPGIEISLKISDTGKVAQQLIDRSIDLGVIGAPVKHEVISLKEFLKDELVIIGPRQTGSRQRGLSIDELTKSNLVLRERDSGTRMMFFEKLEANGVDTNSLQVVMELGSTRAIISAVESGLGLSVVSRLAALDSLALGKIREIRVQGIDNITRYLYLAWNKNKYRSYALKAFFSYLNSSQEISNKISGALVNE